MHTAYESKQPLFEVHDGGLNIKYQRKVTDLFHEQFQKEWRCEDESILRIAFAPSWYTAKATQRYDGITWTTMTLCGIEVTITHASTGYPRDEAA